MNKITSYAKAYLLVAILVGLLIATANSVEFTFRGNPVQYPRFTAAMIGGAGWPILLLMVAANNGFSIKGGHLYLDTE